MYENYRRIANALLSVDDNSSPLTRASGLAKNLGLPVSVVARIGLPRNRQLASSANYKIGIDVGNGLPFPKTKWEVLYSSNE